MGHGLPSRHDALSPTLLLKMSKTYCAFVRWWCILIRHVLPYFRRDAPVCYPKRSLCTLAESFL
nr:MAG TPA: hypothetical protein [Caudoviricetes sp.]